jgi:hypothetical protein
VHGGDIRSFDGDRVMAVFLGNQKNTNAAKSALKINWAVINVLRPKIHAKYPVLARDGFEIKHCVGIDRSDVLVARSGIRDHNDLIGSAEHLTSPQSSRTFGPATPPTSRTMCSANLLTMARMVETRSD